MLLRLHRITGAGIGYSCAAAERSAHSDSSLQNLHLWHRKLRFRPHKELLRPSPSAARKLITILRFYGRSLCVGGPEENGRASQASFVCRFPFRLSITEQDYFPNYFQITLSPHRNQPNREMQVHNSIKGAKFSADHWSHRPKANIKRE